MEQKCIFCGKDITNEPKCNPFPLESASEVCCEECYEHLVKPSVAYGVAEEVERRKENGLT